MADAEDVAIIEAVGLLAAAFVLGVSVTLTVQWLWQHVHVAVSWGAR